MNKIRCAFEAVEVTVAAAALVLVLRPATRWRPPPGRT